MNELVIEQVFSKIKTIIVKGKNQENSDKELIDEFDNWINQLDKQSKDSFLPIKMSQRHIDIIENLQKSGVWENSAEVLSKKFGVSHDTINNDIHEIIDSAIVHWYPIVNYSALNLYPFIYRITLKNELIKKVLIEKLKEIPYNVLIHEGYINKNPLITGYLICPLIVHNQLDNYFNVLSKDGRILNYFFSQRQRRFIGGSLTTMNLPFTKETFEKIITNKSDYDIKQFKYLDELFDASKKAPSRKLNYIFESNILAFLSLIRMRSPVKGFYGLFVEEFIELCKANDIDPSITDDTMRFINNLEQRCKRLDLLDYSLVIWGKSSHTSTLYFELENKTANKLFNQLLNQLSSIANVNINSTFNKLIISLSGISSEHPLKEVISNYLENQNITFQSYFCKLIPESRKCIPLHQLYDYENQRWKFTY